MISLSEVESTIHKGVVSVIIPTLNSEKTIGAVLASLERQKYPDIEIIIVDGGSVDRTLQIVGSTRSIVTLKDEERSQSKNFGATISHGEILYFIDDDFVLEESVILDAVRELNNGFDAVLIPNRCDPSGSFWNRARNLERDCYLDDWNNVATRFMKRNVFFSVGGFDKNLYSAEDYDLHLRILASGYRIVRNSSTEWNIGEPATLGEIARKASYYGANATEFLLKYPKLGFKLLMPFRLAYIRHWKKLLRHPFLSIGIVLENVVKYFWGYVGYCASRSGKNLVSPRRKVKN